MKPPVESVSYVARAAGGGDSTQNARSLSLALAISSACVLAPQGAFWVSMAEERRER
jgi:hypothetical protein